MKYVLLILLVVGRGYTMDIESQLEEVSIDVPNASSHRRSSSMATDIAGKIADLIIKYDSEDKSEDEKFKTLVVSYFKKESLEIQTKIEPHLKQKLRDSDSDIKQILELDDRKALEKLVHKLITESIEDAFKDQTNQFDELKELAESRLTKSKYALIAAIVSGVLGVVGTFCGAYFGH